MNNPDFTIGIAGCCAIFVVHLFRILLQIHLVMHKILLVVFGALLLMSCRQKNETLHPGADSLSAGADSLALNRKLVFLDCNAMVVGEGVRMRETPDTRAEVVEKLNTGVLLKIIRTGDKKVLMGNPERCNPDGHFWYEVMESGGKKGWIYGEFLYPLIIKGRNDQELHAGLQSMTSRKYMFGEQWYQIGFAASGYRQFITPVNDTLCVDYIMPFLYADNEGVTYPLRFLPNKKNRIHMEDLTKDMGYLRFTNGGRFDDKVSAFRMLEDELQITIERELAVDGVEPFPYTLCIKAADGYFYATPSDPGKVFLPQKKQ